MKNMGLSFQYLKKNDYDQRYLETILKNNSRMIIASDESNIEIDSGDSSLEEESKQGSDENLNNGLNTTVNDTPIEYFDGSNVGPNHGLDEHAAPLKFFSVYWDDDILL